MTCKLVSDSSAKGSWFLFSRVEHCSTYLAVKKKSGFIFPRGRKKKPSQISWFFPVFFLGQDDGYLPPNIFSVFFFQLIGPEKKPDLPTYLFRENMLKNYMPLWKNKNQLPLTTDLDNTKLECYFQIISLVLPKRFFFYSYI